MNADRIFLVTIAAMIAIGFDVGFRNPIFDINIQTTMKFDIFTVGFAYILGFVMCWISMTKKDETKTHE